MERRFQHSLHFSRRGSGLRPQHHNQQNTERQRHYRAETGFYFLFDEARITISEAIRLLQQTFAAGAAFEGEMPGGSVSECGNCRNLDVALARECCRYYAEVIADWSVEKLAYPTGK